MSLVPVRSVGRGAALLCGALTAVASSHVAAATDAGLAFFEKQIRPLLLDHCYECHSTESGKTKGGLRLDSRAALLRGGDSGPAVRVGDAEASLLVEAVRYHNKDMEMPPDGRLPETAVAALEQWIAMGLPDPREDPDAAPAAADRPDPMEARRSHWALQSLNEVAVPEGVAPHPIDAFIRTALAAQGLQPSAPADRRTLLRRVTFDLTGLPPTPEELAAFESDPSPQAWVKVIDRLLASPHYGERWGRHWLDVARYADSNGLDENLALGTAWRYRDYVVRSFNADKPFDRFLVEQLAGDLLDAPDLATRHEQMTATAFLNLGAKVLAEADKEKLVMDIIDEQLDTLGKAFLGMTFGCARCHDHKFDPVSQADYYALAAVFKSTRSLSTSKQGAVSHAYEQPLGSLDDFAAGIAREQALTRAKSALTKAENAANSALLEQARGQAADYLAAAARLGAQPSLSRCRSLVRGTDLKAELVLNGRLYLDTHPDDAFFTPWREAVADGSESARRTMRDHYQNLFALAAGDSDAQDVVEARKQLQAKTGFLTLPSVEDPLYPPETLAAILQLRTDADEVERNLPDLPTTLGVADADEVHSELAIHIRGSHLNLGEPVRRSVPEVMQVAMKPNRPVAFPATRSGRLELAQWLARADHPLTSRVIVNRVWAWHFGQGLVATPDNFGLLGATPSHPELLDWLAQWLPEHGWSLKALHRLLLTSATYQQASLTTAPDADPENQLLSGFPVRRLEAEEIRDALLLSAGLLDPTAGGKTVPLRNRQFVFNHTSKDATTYDSLRRALYLPVIRNHLYDWFQQFDYPDPSMPTGLRGQSVVAPQALQMMNSPLVLQAADAMAVDLHSQPMESALETAAARLYGRTLSSGEVRRCRDFLVEFDARLASSESDANAREQRALAALIQTLMMADELVYLR